MPATNATTEFVHVDVKAAGIALPNLAHQVLWVPKSAPAYMDGNHAALVLSSGGPQLAANFLVVLDLRGGEASVANLFPLQDGFVYNAAQWSPLGDKVAFAGRVDEEVSFVEEWEPSTGTTKATARLRGTFVHQLEWLDENRLVCGLLGNQNFLVGSPGAMSRLAVRVSEPLSHPVKFALDRERARIYFATAFRVHELDLRSKQVRKVVEFAEPADAITHLQLDEAWQTLFVLTRGGHLHVVDLTARRAVDAIELCRPNPVHFLFHQESDAAAVVSKEGTIAVYRLENYEELFRGVALLPRDARLRTPLDLRWNEDGNALLGAYLHAPDVLLRVSIPGD
ncbi:MAG: hypothetical protein Kow0069_13670 [Promethearchaeota archaeon]